MDERGALRWGPDISKTRGYRPLAAAGLFRWRSSVCLPGFTSTLVLLPTALGGMMSAGSIMPELSPRALAAADIFAISSLLTANLMALTASTFTTFGPGAAFSTVYRPFVISPPADGPLPSVGRRET